MTVGAGLGWSWIVAVMVEGVGMTVGAGLGWAWINVGAVEDVGLRTRSSWAGLGWP